MIRCPSELMLQTDAMDVEMKLVKVTSWAAVTATASKVDAGVPSFG